MYFRNTDFCTNAYMHATTINKKIINLKDCGEGDMGGFKGRKGREKCSQIAILKINKKEKYNYILSLMWSNRRACLYIHQCPS